ncbi:MAG: LamG-like jellyroll fold domain-containing protein [Bacteroidota bacterium]
MRIFSSFFLVILAITASINAQSVPIPRGSAHSMVPHSVAKEIAAQNQTTQQTQLHENRGTKNIDKVSLVNAGSAYFPSHFNSRIRVVDGFPNDPSSNESAYKTFTNQITVEAWAFPTDLPPDDGFPRTITLLSRPGSYVLEIFYDGANYFYLFEFKNTSGSWNYAWGYPVQVGQWAHIAGTYNGDSVSFFLNGNFYSSQIATGNIAVGSTGFYLGADINQEHFKGLIDEVRLWDVARTQAAISSNKSVQLTGTETNLKGYWQLDETPGNTLAIDKTANKNHLNVQFGATFVDDAAESVVAIAPTSFPVTPFRSVVNQHGVVHVFSGWPVPVANLFSAPQGIIQHGHALEWTPDFTQFGRTTAQIDFSNSEGTSSTLFDAWVDKFPETNVEQGTGIVYISSLNNGKIGYNSSQTIGKGFTYKGLYGLFNGGVLIGSSSSKVSDAGVSSGTPTDFATRGWFDPIRSTLPGFDRATEFFFDDEANPSRVGVSIVQRTHTRTGDKFAILEYQVMNTSGHDLSNVYVGLELDWDIGNYASNVAGFDVVRKLSYVRDVSGYNPYYYGATVLNAPLGGHYNWKVTDPYTDSARYVHLGTISPATTDTGDIRASVSAGPYNIPKGKSVRVYFALLGGDNLTDIQQAADQALNVPLESLKPMILKVRDVPNDQGGKVMVEWNASSLDNALNQMWNYEIWREVKFGNGAIENRGMQSPIRQMSVNGVMTGWELVETVPPHNFNTYAKTIETLFDSTSKSIGMNHFLVSARASEWEYYDSPVDSGFSKDNIHPNAPQSVGGFVEAAKVKLQWAKNVEEDLLQYRIYRSDSSNININVIAPYAVVTETETTFVDQAPLQHGYYTIVAEDIHENLSSKSTEVNFIITGVQLSSTTVPTVFSLSQNYPNPFNPSTTISFGLPEASNVTVKIYDALGREVASLVNDQLTTGYYTYAWNAGHLASGVYIYRMTALSNTNKAQPFNEAKKLLLMK